MPEKNSYEALLERVDALENERQRSRLYEEELRVERDRARNYLNLVQVIVVALNAEGRITLINPKGCRVLGWNERELIGRNWFSDCLPQPEGWQEVYPFFLKLMAGKVEDLNYFENPIITRSGERRYIAWQTTLLHDESGSIIGILSAGEDITDKRKAEEEKKRLERQLRQAHQLEAIGTLAGGIAHDFNNILMAIQGRVSLLAMEIEPGQPYSDHIAAIETYIHSACQLTRKLLGVAHRGKYEVSAIDLNHLLESTAEMFSRTRKELPIHTRLAETKLVVEADRQQLEQVFLNMFVNARQAMPDGGELFLETASVTLGAADCASHEVSPGDYAKISITDTGIGMDKATCRRVFDPFFTTREKSRGTGLGLAAAYGIIKNHGGRITLYSEPGRGTTFNIYLPLSLNAVRPKIPAAKELTSGSGSILLVDDEKIIRDVGKAMLERMGYHVLAAGGGEEATRMVTENGPVIDLVILDLIMPVIDGPATFRRIRELYPRMPVLLSSGYAVNGAAEELLKCERTWFIQKPYNIRVLSEKVRAILEQKDEGR